MVDIIITTINGVDYATLQNASLDLAFGSDQNDFELSFTDEIDESLFGNGSHMYLDGTEYGGIVDKVTSDIENGVPVLTYAGRTWHGVLEKKILTPDAGQDYLKVSGSVSSVLTALMSRVGLGGLFTVAPNTTQISYQFDRYVTAYTGIRSMLAANNLKLMMTSNQHGVVLSVTPVTDMGTQVDSDQLDFTLERDYRPVNHLIGLGKGELRDRAVTHWYADSNGVVSQKQSLTGADEIAATYDYSNAELAELNENTQKKLKELQSQGSLDIQLRETEETYYVGDVLTGRDNTTGLTVTSEVTKKIVKIEDGVLSVNYEVGDESTSQSLSGSSESSGGGGALQNAEERLENPTFVNGFDGWSSQWRMSDSPIVDHWGVSRLLPVCDQVGGGYGNKYLQGSTTVPVKPGQVWQLQAWAKVLSEQSGRTLALQLKWLDASGNQHWTWVKTLDASAKTDWTLLSATIAVPSMAVSATLWLHVSVQADDAVQVLVDSCSLKDITESAATFLAAYPIGSLFHTTVSANPGTSYGGTWGSLPSQVGYLWERLS